MRAVRFAAIGAAGRVLDAHRHVGSLVIARARLVLHLRLGAASVGLARHRPVSRARAALARGEPFGTTDVPWGYAYFVARFLPALRRARRGFRWSCRSSLNAAVAVAALPRSSRPLAGRTRRRARGACSSALFSFNTVYASTQSSDAVCTVLFLASLLVLRARCAQSAASVDFAAQRRAVGLVPQFRPNMILFPALIAAAYCVVRPHAAHPLARDAVFAVVGRAAR